MSYRPNVDLVPLPMKADGWPAAALEMVERIQAVGYQKSWSGGGSLRDCLIYRGPTHHSRLEN